MPADPTPRGGCHPAVVAVRDVSNQLGLWHETARAMGDRDAERLIGQFIGLVSDCQERVADAVPYVITAEETRRSEVPAVQPHDPTQRVSLKCERCTVTLTPAPGDPIPDRCSICWTPEGKRRW